jgi:hypothetical protein
VILLYIYIFPQEFASNGTENRALNPLKTPNSLEFYIISSYRAVNTLRIGYKTSQLMLYREIIAVYSDIHTQHINALCGPNVEFLNDKPGGTYSGHSAFKSYKHSIVLLPLNMGPSTSISISSKGGGGASNGGREKPYIYFRMAFIILTSFCSLLRNIIPYVSKACFASIFRCRPIWCTS